MKFRNFCGVSRTSAQAYFKDGIELLYADQKRPLRVAILPAYNPSDPDPAGWIPAVPGEGEESDFYTIVHAAKFVGHGNRMSKSAFLSPRTFDLSADDPYEAFVDYCSRSDDWSYLTKDPGKKRMIGEIDGAIFPPMKNFLCANVMDVSAGSRGGVFVAEFSECVAKSLLYSMKKNGSRVNGIAFERDEKGNLIFGDITDPKSALVVEIAMTGRGYVARPAVDVKGNVQRVEIPSTLLQHRQHMEEPGTFLAHPGSGQDIVDRLAGMLRGYRSEKGRDELEALEEAMEFAYGKKYSVKHDVSETRDPFGDAASTVKAEPEKKVEAVADAVERGVKQEKYTPVKPPTKPSKPGPTPREDINPADIAALRMMLGGK